MMSNKSTQDHVGSNVGNEILDLLKSSDINSLEAIEIIAALLKTLLEFAAKTRVVYDTDVRHITKYLESCTRDFDKSTEAYVEECRKANEAAGDGDVVDGVNKPPKYLN